MTNIQTFDDLVNAALAINPRAVVEEGEDGELIICTRLAEGPHGLGLVEMTDKEDDTQHRK